MAITVEGSGTQTATVTTEHTLHTETDESVLVLKVDTSNMAAGDILELRVKDKVLTGSTSAEAYKAVYAHAQEDPVKISAPIVCMFETVFTLKQTAGTGRDFEWSVISLQKNS